MEQITIFIMGIAAGMSILGCLIISGAKRLEKRYDRDCKDTQSNEKRDSGLYPVSSERGAESSVSGSSDNGESLDITKELALYSRNVLTQYCNSQRGCGKCCFERDGGCSLISGPPCMWERRECQDNEENE